MPTRRHLLILAAALAIGAGAAGCRNSNGQVDTSMFFSGLVKSPISAAASEGPPEPSPEEQLDPVIEKAAENLSKDLPEKYAIALSSGQCVLTISEKLASDVQLPEESLLNAMKSLRSKLAQSGSIAKHIDVIESTARSDASAAKSDEASAYVLSAKFLKVTGPNKFWRTYYLQISVESPQSKKFVYENQVSSRLKWDSENKRWRQV